MENLRASIVRHFYVITLLALLTACADQGSVVSEYGSTSTEPAQSLAAAQNSKLESMAYEHQLYVQLEASLIASVYGEIVSQCANDTRYNCVVISSSLSVGEYQLSNVSLRVESEGVAYFSKIAVKKGVVVSRSTRAQDLSDSVLDNAKRSEMAIRYRDKLLKLEAQEGNDIDSMVKIASELSKVQSTIEFAQGEKATLSQKIDSELINISITAPPVDGFLGPIDDAMSSFIDDLAYGVSSVISSAAVIIPWFIFIVLLLLISRFIYRRLSSKE